MKFNLTEQNKRKIQKRIPRMAKTIREGRFVDMLQAGADFATRKIIDAKNSAVSGLQSAAGVAGRAAEATYAAGKAAGGMAIQAGKQYAAKQWDIAGENQEKRAEQFQRDVLDHHFANHLGVSVQEFRRVRDDVPSTMPTPPSTHVKDPNTGGLIPNPQYAVEMQRHKAEMEDYNTKQYHTSAIASLIDRDRTLGRAHEQLYGRMRIDPRNRNAPPNNMTQVGGILKRP